MHLLNLAHPLTERQQEQVTALVGQPAERLIEAKVQFDLNQPFAPQVAALIDSLGISPNDWQTGVWLVALPSLNYITAGLLAELHGRMGHFPAMLRLKPVPGALITEYEVAEIINLEQVRQQARTRR
jgi:hypothetical protein